MSLINDALKKAQKQRTGEAPSLSSLPAIGGESPRQIARRPNPPGFDTLILRVGLGGAVVIALAVGAFFALREKPAPAPHVGSPLAGVPSPSAPGSQLQPPGSQLAAPSSSDSAQVSGFRSQVSGPALPIAGQSSLPVAPKTEPALPTFTVPVASKTSPASEQPKAAQPPAVPPSVLRPPSSAVTAAAPLKLEPRAIQFIENIKIGAIRTSATDSKVLMNDRVYRLGSIVEAELGLKLVEIATGALTFEDDRGARYTRTF